jgi:hypothetical protein
VLLALSAMAAVGCTSVLVPPVPDAHAVRDVFPGRIADSATGDQPDRPCNDRTRERTHGRIAGATRLRLRRPGAERECRDDDADA